MNGARKRFVLLAMLAALSGGAAASGIHKPDSPSTLVAAGQAPAATGRDAGSEWAALFQSPFIGSMVKRAFSAHPEVGSVQAALLRAQGYPFIKAGFFYPVVTSDQPTAAELDDDSRQVAANREAAKGYFSFHSAQLEIGYEPELLAGKSDRSVPDTLRAAMQREASYTTLASNVTAAAIQEAALRAQIEAQLNIVGFNRQSLEIAHNQFKLGYLSEEDVTRLELGAAQAQQALGPLQLQLEQVGDLLVELVGNPEDEDAERLSMETLQLNREVPLGLPSRLIEQRPDVRLAEARLQAVAAQNGVRLVNMQPRFNISGAAGGNHESPRWMFRSGGRFFDPKGKLAPLLFEVRALRSKSLPVRQALEQAAQEYRKVVMFAVQQVADTLNTVSADERALKAAVKAAQAAGGKGEQARRQYEAGSADFQTLLVAQLNEQQATINLLRAQSNRAGDTILLWHALGGHWWKPEALDPARGR